MTHFTSCLRRRRARYRKANAAAIDSAVNSSVRKKARIGTSRYADLSVPELRSPARGDAPGAAEREIAALTQMVAELQRAKAVAEAALDVCGRPVFALDPDGAPCWFTPLATSMLERLFPGWNPSVGTLPEELGVPLKRLLTGDPAMRQITLLLGETRLECAVLRRVDCDEWLFRLHEKRAGDQERVLAERHGLTSREAQVLLWISCGKQNREVGEILDISPRTVSKHLEQIFQKIGVENRASAAGVAVTTLGR